jgi:hypothetical protein
MQEHDRPVSAGSCLLVHGSNGGKRREVGIDAWAWQYLEQSACSLVDGLPSEPKY